MSNIFNNVTTEEFKAYFAADFPYLPVWNYSKTYWQGDIAYINGCFYQSTIDDNCGNNPINQAGWQKVKGDESNYITDADIQRAMSQALLNANERFGETDNDKITIFLHLVAFYLVLDIKNASSGLGSSYTGTLQSKSVGGVSVSYNIPSWVNENPMYSIFTSNGYGLKYLSLIAPYMACTIIFSPGRTTIG